MSSIITPLKIIQHLCELFCSFHVMFPPPVPLGGWYAAGSIHFWIELNAYWRRWMFFHTLSRRVPRSRIASVMRASWPLLRPPAGRALRQA